jgi:hypothetical protein
MTLCFFQPATVAYSHLVCGMRIYIRAVETFIGFCKVIKTKKVTFVMKLFVSALGAVLAAGLWSLGGVWGLCLFVLLAGLACVWVMPTNPIFSLDDRRLPGKVNPSNSPSKSSKQLHPAAFFPQHFCVGLFLFFFLLPCVLAANVAE